MRSWALLAERALEDAFKLIGHRFGVRHAAGTASSASTAAQELDAIGREFKAGSQLTLIISPQSRPAWVGWFLSILAPIGLETGVNQHLPPFLEVLAAILSRFPPHGGAQPDSVVFVSGLAIDGNVERGYGCATARKTQLRVLAQIPNGDHFGVTGQPLLHLVGLETGGGDNLKWPGWCRENGHGPPCLNTISGPPLSSPTR